MRFAFALALVAQFMQARILVHGHRGARAVRPENTMPAFEYAIQAGADVLELDLAVTKDNVLVVSHDASLPENICSGGSGTRVIRHMTLAELKQWDCGAKKNPGYPEQQPVPGTRVPTLDEVLELAPRGKFEFNIETKLEKPQYAPEPDDFARLLVEAIRRHRLEARCIIQSFDFRTLIAAARMAPEIRRAALYMGKQKDLVAMAKNAKAQILAPHFSLITPETVAKAHAEGLEVVPWTPNKTADWDRMIEAGVDAIITDDPARLIAHLKGRKPRQ